MARVAGFSESLEGTPVNSVVVQFIVSKPGDHDRIETFLSQNTESQSQNARLSTENHRETWVPFPFVTYWTHW